MDFSWAWVGFPPRDRIRIPSSEGAILPSPSVSKSVKASFIEETWSSLKPSLPIVYSGFSGRIPGRDFSPLIWFFFFSVQRRLRSECVVAVCDF